MKTVLLVLCSLFLLAGPVWAQAKTQTNEEYCFDHPGEISDRCTAGVAKVPTFPSQTVPQPIAPLPRASALPDPQRPLRDFRSDSEKRIAAEKERLAPTPAVVVPAPVMPPAEPAPTVIPDEVAPPPQSGAQDFLTGFASAFTAAEEASARMAQMRAQENAGVRRYEAEMAADADEAGKLMEELRVDVGDDIMFDDDCNFGECGDPRKQENLDNLRLNWGNARDIFCRHYASATYAGLDSQTYRCGEGLPTGTDPLDWRLETIERRMRVESALTTQDRDDLRKVMELSDAGLFKIFFDEHSTFSPDLPFASMSDGDPETEKMIENRRGIWFEARDTLCRAFPNSRYVGLGHEAGGPGQKLENESCQ